ALVLTAGVRRSRATGAALAHFFLHLLVFLKLVRGEDLLHLFGMFRANFAHLVAPFFAGNIAELLHVFHVLFKSGFDFRFLGLSQIQLRREPFQSLVDPWATRRPVGLLGRAI